MITETLDHDRDIGVGLVISLPHKEQFFFFTFICHLRRKQKIDPS